MSKVSRLFLCVTTPPPLSSSSSSVFSLSLGSEGLVLIYSQGYGSEWRDEWPWVSLWTFSFNLMMMMMMRFTGNVLRSTCPCRVFLCVCVFSLKVTWLRTHLYFCVTCWQVCVCAGAYFSTCLSMNASQEHVSNAAALTESERWIVTWRVVLCVKFKRVTHLSNLPVNSVFK